jgi:serine/threonine-protein kinase
MALENSPAITIRKPVTAAHLQTCRACAHEFRVPASLVGKRVACPHCRRPIDIKAESGSDDKLVGKELGGCRLVRRLGAGAIGVVYQAEQISIGRQVAIKMLSSKAAGDPKVVQRFQRESKLCAQMQHPNVVSVYDCGFERGVHYLVMEYVEGQTLAGMLDEAERIPWAKAARLILQVGRGLEHAHGMGIIHRDIKPANILVGNDGTAKLADLGLAKQLEDEGGMGDSPLGLTMQGVALGSPAYMPPEQIRSAKDVTPVSDLYALGASFYQLVTGVLPFDGKSAPEVMTKVLREEAKPVAEIAPEVPPAIAGFIRRTLEKEPAHRPQSASAFIVELEDAFNNPAKAPPERPRGTGSANKKLMVRARSPSRPDHAAAVGRSGGSHLGVVVALIAVVVVAGVFAWLHWMR